MQNNSIIKDKTLSNNDTVTTQVNSGAMGVESYGKFKDRESLLSAYNSLQAEFTRRCQRVKELERMLNATKTNNSVLETANNNTNQNEVSKLSVNSAQTDMVKQEVLGEQTSISNDFSEETKKKIIREYLNEIKSSKPEISLMSGNGTAIISPPSKPRSITEAGELAKKILSNKEIY